MGSFERIASGTLELKFTNEQTIPCEHDNGIREEVFSAIMVWCGRLSGQLDVNLYMQLATASLNIANVTVTPGSTNASLATTSWSYVSNAPLNAQIQVNGLPTNEFGDTIPTSSVMVGQVSPAGSCTSSTCTHLSLTLQNYATNQPVQASPTLTMYWYISPPNPMVPGTYTFTYTLNLQWTGTYPS